MQKSLLAQLGIAAALALGLSACGQTPVPATMTVKTANLTVPNPAAACITTFESQLNDQGWSCLHYDAETPSRLYVRKTDNKQNLISFTLGSTGGPFASVVVDTETNTATVFALPGASFDMSKVISNLDLQYDSKTGVLYESDPY